MKVILYKKNGIIYPLEYGSGCSFEPGTDYYLLTIDGESEIAPEEYVEMLNTFPHLLKTSDMIEKL